MKSFALVLACLSLAFIAGDDADAKKAKKLDALVISIIEANKPLHLDQVHALVELLQNRGDTFSVDDVCGSLQRLVVEKKAVMEAVKHESPAGERMLPPHIVYFDDIDHKEDETGNER